MSSARAVYVKSDDNESIALGKCVVYDESANTVRLYDSQTDTTADIFGVTITKDPSVMDISYNCPFTWRKLQPYAYDDFGRYTFSGNQNISNPTYDDTIDVATDDSIQYVCIIGFVPILNGEPLKSDWICMDQNTGQSTKFYFIDR